MVELTLVRHGQANSGATDEATYDRLSDLGHQQAKWLGQHFDSQNIGFDQIVSGTLQRQNETAKEIAAVIGGDVVQDARLNEIAYFDLAQSLADFDGTPVPSNQPEFFDHIPKTLAAWEAGHIDENGNTYGAFKARITATLDSAQDHGGRVLYVTSGGVIAMVMRHVLGLDIPQKAHMLLQTRNSSVHRLHARDGQLRLDVFNAIPHLEHPDRAYARTYV